MIERERHSRVSETPDEDPRDDGPDTGDIVDTFAIGHADSFGLVVDGGITTVEYDLRQVQKQGFALYRLDGASGSIGGKNVYYETDELPLGTQVSTAVARDAIDTVELDVHGFVVPDHLLGTFIRAFPDREMFRET